MEACVTPAPLDVFADSRARFESLVAMLSGAEASTSTHGELEERLHAGGMELLRCLFQALLRCLFQDHLRLRALQEQRVDAVTGTDGVPRTRAERGRTRALATVFGAVEVERMVYRSPGVPGLHPADMALSLPGEKHSHGLRRRAALEAVRGSFGDARAAIARCCASAAAKRQVEELVTRAATDMDDFYRHQWPEPADADTSPRRHWLRVPQRSAASGTHAGALDREVAAREQTGVVDGGLPLDQIWSRCRGPRGTAPGRPEHGVRPS
jgi:hypothetical protein